jgi:dTDP-glucose 4,6-dehydratase/UDP-glucose 4-epimerase
VNILVIGSNGFIGSNIKKYFMGKKYKIFSCDITDNPNKTNFIKLDLNNSDFNLLFINNKYDVCINCSGAASVPKSFDNTLYDYELNTTNVLKILDAIKTYNTECKFINISSASVYGNPEKLPINEDDDLSPISPYGYHKLLSEKILDEYNKLWNIKTCSARIFSAYGNGLKKQILFDISNKIKSDIEIKLFGTGNETRDFIHIDDICCAIDCIIKNGTFESTKINIANGQQIKINEIIQIVNNYWDHGKKVVFDSIERTGDPVNWLADITKLQSYGYKQGVTISDGIKRYVEWIKNEQS